MRYFLLLILLCKLSLASYKTCLVYLESITNPGNKIALKQTLRGHQFTIEDPDDIRFHFDAKLDPSGTLNISVNKEDGDYRADWRASEAFGLALLYFGDKVKNINSVWFYGSNLEAFLVEKKLGTPDKEAVFNTWTGEQAWKHGFRNVTSFKTRKNIKGVINWVSVVFSK